jgi:hypothetical protein
VENDEDGYADAKRGNKRGNLVCAYWIIYMDLVSYGINMKDTLFKKPVNISLYPAFSA